MGHAQTRNFVSLPLQMSPQDGKAFNCWFPMPYQRARFEVSSECAENVLLYYYIDYEVTEVDARQGRFHAQALKRRIGIHPEVGPIRIPVGRPFGRRVHAVPQLGSEAVRKMLSSRLAA